MGTYTGSTPQWVRMEIMLNQSMDEHINAERQVHIISRNYIGISEIDE